MKRIIILMIGVLAAFTSFSQTARTFNSYYRYGFSSTGANDSVNYATQNLWWVGPNGYRYSFGGVKHSLKDIGSVGSFWKTSGTSNLTTSTSIDLRGNALNFTDGVGGGEIYFSNGIDNDNGQQRVLVYDSVSNRLKFRYASTIGSGAFPIDSAGSRSSEFIPVKGVFGDGSDDVLQMVDASNAVYTHTLPNNFTFETVFKTPTTITSSEGLFSSVPTITLNNLFFLDFIEYSASPQYFLINASIWDNSGSAVASLNSPVVRYTSGNEYRENTHIMIRCELSGSTYLYTMWVNGVKVGPVGSPTTKPSSWGFNWLTDRNAGGRYSDATILGTRFYDRALSDAECLASYNQGAWTESIGSGVVFDFRFDNLSSGKFLEHTLNGLKIDPVNFAAVASNIVTPYKSSGYARLLLIGNSLFSAGAPEEKTMVYLMPKTNFIEGYILNSISGRKTSEIYSAFNTLDLPRKDLSKQMNIAAIWEITNELRFGVNTGTAYENYRKLCKKARVNGFKVVAVTVLPRSDVGTPSDFETSRQAINSLIRNNYKEFADEIADVASNDVIGDAGDETNATYYSDLVHTTSAGAVITSSIIGDAVLRIINGKTYDNVTSGSFSQVGTATTTFTVDLGRTVSNPSYQVTVEPTSLLSSASFYVSNKTTSSFDVVYLSGLTGTVTFDWSIHK
jgi:hypothetical protein